VAVTDGIELPRSSSAYPRRQVFGQISMLGATSAVAPLPQGAESDPIASTWPDLVHAQVHADAATGTPIALDVRFVQNGPPLLVWGTGCEEVNPGGTTPLERNNYYYSFTRLAASGTITIDGESVPVEGTTWMDHEYGYFGSAGAGPNWVLQDMQLDNGVSGRISEADPSRPLRLRLGFRLEQGEDLPAPASGR
jgi:hypothetical protein